MTYIRTVLFASLNSPGHVNSALGIADELKRKHNFRCVFLILGDPIGNAIKDHGHELVILKEANVHEDYELEDGEDTRLPVDEELKKQQGKSKRKFPGAFKWPQMIQRRRHFFRLPPLESFVAAADIFEKFMVAEVVDNHDAYKAAIESINPDLVIVDSYYVAPCIAALKHIPWVKLFSANPFGLIKSKLPDGIRPPPQVGAQLFTKEIREKMRKDNPEKWEAIVKDWKDQLTIFKGAISSCGGGLEELAKDYDCPPLEPGIQSYDSPHLNVYLYPKDIDYDQDDDIFYYPPRWFRASMLIRSSLLKTKPKDAEYWTEKLNEGLKNKNGMIFFSLGSLASGDHSLMVKFIQMIEADTKRLYVISKGVNGDKFELNSENMIGGNFIPQTFFLEKADLAIIHGGNNSVVECMYFGVPMIVLPMFGDQHDNARRIEDLDLGRFINPHECTQEALEKAIDEVLSNKQLIERCCDIGKRLRADNDLEKITMMIKKLTEEKTLDQNFIDDCRSKKVDEINW